MADNTPNVRQVSGQILNDDIPSKGEPSLPPAIPPSGIPASIPSPSVPPSATPLSAAPSPTTHSNSTPSSPRIPDDLSTQWRRTKCLNCGYIHEGTGVLTTCPKCGNSDADKFQEAE